MRSGPGLLRWQRLPRALPEDRDEQGDRAHGPDAQRDLQDRAARRFGLVDTGLAWSAVHSGATVHRSPMMAAMPEAARSGAFDVLLVGSFWSGREA